MIQLIACSIVVLAALLATPARAESFTSSASSAGSASSASVSDSLRGSSDSSSGRRQVADGDYRVIQVADAAGRPGMLRITLRAVAADDEFALELPAQALAARGLAAGDRVQARNRPYGIEFAHAALPQRPREAFFLVLADDWQREIAPRAVGL